MTQKNLILGAALKGTGAFGTRAAHRPTKRKPVETYRTPASRLSPATNPEGNEHYFENLVNFFAKRKFRVDERGGGGDED